MLRSLFPRPVRVPVLAAVLTGTLIATVTTQIMVPRLTDDDSTFLLGSMRYWICTLSGGALMVVLLLGARHPATDETPSAAEPPGEEVTSAHLVLAGAVTTIAVGLGQFARDALDLSNDSGRNLGNFLRFVQVPLWLLCLLIVVLGPLVRLGVDLLRRRLPQPAVRRPVLEPRSRPRRSPCWRYRWRPGWPLR